MLLGNIIKDGFLGIILTLDSIIYSLISSAYKIFMALAGARLLSTDAYTAIANKIYIVVGVVMLFVLAYAMLKAIIDPDQAAKGDLGGPKLIKHVIIAVIGLAVAPVLFNLLYQVQGLVMENNVLGKLFFRSDNETYDYPDITINNGEETVMVPMDEESNYYNNMIQKIGGAHVATTIWQAFFYPVEEGQESEIEADSSVLHVTSVGLGLGCAVGIGVAIAGVVGSFFTAGTSLLIAGAGLAACVASASTEGKANKIDELLNGKTFTLEEAYIYTSSEGDFWIYQGFIEPLSDDEIHYSWFLSTVVGLFVAYAFVTFSIDMGMRAAKLAYYQIIAPIPIILQILPKFKDSFNKYIKSVISTFIEVFIRITVVYVIVYIMCHLTDMFSTSAMWAGMNLPERMLARALLMVGLVLFAKQAPKMIGETFGIQSGSLDLGIRKKLAEGGAFTAGAFLGGGISTGVRAMTNAGANIKKNWNDKVKGQTFANGREKFKAGASVIGGGIARGALSTVAGTASGAVRSGYAGRKAANVKDMQSAAREGIGRATLKRDQRATYRDSHQAMKIDELEDAVRKNTAGKTGIKKWTAGISTIVGGTGVAGGHAQDAVTSVLRWAGISNTETLKKELEGVDKFDKSLDDLKNAAKTLINGDAQKNKNKDYGVKENFDYSKLNDKLKNNSYVQQTFKNFSTATLNTLQKQLEIAKTKGEIDIGGNKFSYEDLAAIEGLYVKQFTEKVANRALATEEHYNSYTVTERTDLADVRSAAAAFKNELQKNIGSSVVADAIDDMGAAIVYNSDGSIDYDKDAQGNIIGYRRTTANSKVTSADITSTDLRIDNEGMISKIQDAAKRRRAKIKEDLADRQAKEEASGKDNKNK